MSRDCVFRSGRCLPVRAHTARDRERRKVCDFGLPFSSQASRDRNGTVSEEPRTPQTPPPRQPRAGCRDNKVPGYLNVDRTEEELLTSSFVCHCEGLGLLQVAVRTDQEPLKEPQGPLVRLPTQKTIESLKPMSEGPSCSPQSRAEPWTPRHRGILTKLTCPPCGARAGGQHGSHSNGFVTERVPDACRAAQRGPAVTCF
ncbi:hypothetical protein FQA47_008423 [Oryzias melastigma]|uniref:Uncharacterized protein n=1 Tax=Oryzias melastigma TaxID=30732 RepID=A0A834FG41_ORYME|nr:hypothetical protein FQA47_008423 [Oryzias melastigma]